MTAPDHMLNRSKNALHQRGHPHMSQGVRVRKYSLKSERVSPAHFSHDCLVRNRSILLRCGE